MDKVCQTIYFYLQELKDTLRTTSDDVDNTTTFNNGSSQPYGSKGMEPLSELSHHRNLNNYLNEAYDTNGDVHLTNYKIMIL